MASNVNDNQTSSVRYSGFLTLSSAIALGASVTVGLGVYLLIGPIFDRIGRQTTAAYLLTIPFFLPIVLTLAERTAVTPGQGGLFNLGQRNNNLLSIFTIGWLIVGGYLFLGATLAWGAGQYLQIGLLRYFNIVLNPVALGALLILVVAFYPLYGTSANWRQRSALIYLSIVLFIIVLLWAIFFPPEEIQGYAYILSGNELNAVPYLAVGLWGISFILDRRQQLKQPSRWSLLVLLAPVLLMGLLGALAAWVVNQYPRLISENLPPLVGLTAAISPIFELLLIVGALILAIFGLSQSLVSLVRLAGLMAESGFLHKEFQRVSPKHQYPLYALIFLASMMGLILLLVPIGNIVTAASGTLMLAIALVHLPGLLSAKSSLPEDRPIKLPLHPLFPALTIAIALTLTLLPTLSNQISFFFWLILGLAYYYLYAQKGGIAVRQSEQVVADEEIQRQWAGNRILAAVHDLALSTAVMDTAVALAQARNAELLLLQVVVLPEQTTDSHRREVAREAWQALTVYAQQNFPDTLTVRPLVRLAPAVVDGLLATIWEERVDTCILGWPDASPERQDEQDGLVDAIVQKASCEVLIPRGQLPKRFKRILVPMMSEVHAPAALAIGQALAGRNGATVVALGFVHEAMTPERSTAAYDRLQKTIAKLDKAEGIEPLVEHTQKPKQQVIENAQNYDLTLLGVSNEGFLAQTRFGGTPTEIALAVDNPVFLVKSRETASHFWLRRAWEQLFNFLPTLTPGEQAAVYLNMRRDAKATIDFFVLIFMSTAIAYFGLLQNSDAVVIGAMLIAPLMSPILALSQGIVRGNARLMREAFQTTSRGAILAIVLATVATLFMISLGAPIPATNAILSRTSPGLLDLMVALVSGLAAAYATSRSSVAGALPGVAIAAALVPPLAVVGYGLGLAQFDIAAGALLLFLTNLAAIILAAAVIFLLLGFRPPTRVERDEQTKFGLRVAGLALVAVTIPLLLTTLASQAQAELTVTIETTIQENWLPNEALATDIVIERDQGELVVNFSLLDFTGEIGTEDIADLQKEISVEVDRPVILRSVITQSQLDIIDEEYDLGSSTPSATGIPAEPAPSTSEPEISEPTDVNPTIPIRPTETATIKPSATETPTP